MEEQQQVLQNTLARRQRRTRSTPSKCNSEELPATPVTATLIVDPDWEASSSAASASGSKPITLILEVFDGCGRVLDVVGGVASAPVAADAERHVAVGSGGGATHVVGEGTLGDGSGAGHVEAAAAPGGTPADDVSALENSRKRAQHE